MVSPIYLVALTATQPISFSISFNYLNIFNYFVKFSLFCTFVNKFEFFPFKTFINTKVFNVHQTLIFNEITVQRLPKYLHTSVTVLQFSLAKCANYAH